MRHAAIFVRNLHGELVCGMLSTQEVSALVAVTGLVCIRPLTVSILANFNTAVLRPGSNHFPRQGLGFIRIDICGHELAGDFGSKAAISICGIFCYGLVLRRGDNRVVIGAVDSDGDCNVLAILLDDFTITHEGEGLRNNVVLVKGLYRGRIVEQGVGIFSRHGINDNIAIPACYLTFARAALHLDIAIPLDAKTLV